MTDELKRSVRLGLIAGVTIVYIGVVGMLEAFNARPIIIDLVNFAVVLVVLTYAGFGFLAGRPGKAAPAATVRPTVPATTPLPAATTAATRPPATAARPATAATGSRPATAATGSRPAAAAGQTGSIWVSAAAGPAAARPAACASATTVVGGNRLAPTWLTM